MNNRPDIVCIGSALWDIIGRSSSVMRSGSDVPGRISRLPGGVALNIALTLVRYGMRPTLLTAIGRDAEGEELANACGRAGLMTDLAYRSADLPTDRYMAVEGANGLIAAIADAHSLEAAGRKILAPLADGRLGSNEVPFCGLIALDGNLTEDLLREIAASPLFASCDLRIAPASPGKAERLLPLLALCNATFYLNLEEAELIAKEAFDTAQSAAEALMDRGMARVIVTDGGNSCADASGGSVHVACPPQVLVTRVTGAGDTFLAAHIASEFRGLGRQEALEAALRSAAAYVSGEVPA